MQQYLYSFPDKYHILWTIVFIRGKTIKMGVYLITCAYYGTLSLVVVELNPSTPFVLPYNGMTKGNIKMYERGFCVRLRLKVRVRFCGAQCVRYVCVNNVRIVSLCAIFRRCRRC